MLQFGIIIAIMAVLTALISVGVTQNTAGGDFEF